jgi:hypothetical protein
MGGRSPGHAWPLPAGRRQVPGRPGCLRADRRTPAGQRARQGLVAAPRRRRYGQRVEEAPPPTALSRRVLPRGPASRRPTGSDPGHVHPGCAAGVGSIAFAVYSVPGRPAFIRPGSRRYWIPGCAIARTTIRHLELRDTQPRSGCRAPRPRASPFNEVAAARGEPQSACAAATFSGDTTRPPGAASMYLMPALRSVSLAVERGHHSRLPEALSAQISIAFLSSREFPSATGSPVRDAH